MGVSIVLDHARLTVPAAATLLAGAITALARSPFRYSSTGPPGLYVNWRSSTSGASSPRSPSLRGHRRARTARPAARCRSPRRPSLASPLDTILVPLPWKSLHAPREPLDPIRCSNRPRSHTPALARRSPLREKDDPCSTISGGRSGTAHRRRVATSSTCCAKERRPNSSLPCATSQPATPCARRVSAGSRASPHSSVRRPGICGPVLDRAGRIWLPAVGRRRCPGARAHSDPRRLDSARDGPRIAGGSHRIGALLAPPYVPLIVGSAAEPGASQAPVQAAPRLTRPGSHNSRASDRSPSRPAAPGPP